MAAAVGAAGLGLGSGTAQASVLHPHPHLDTTTFNQRFDNFLDGIQGLFRVGQGTPFDNRIDAIFGVN